MGYTTDFSGALILTPALNKEQVAYLQAFSQSRRMKRDPNKTAERKDTLRESVKLPVGVEGEFFVNEQGVFGQDPGYDVIDSNRSPKTQPNLWCQWTVSNDGTRLYWDEGDKFYDYIPWMKYIIKNFFERWEIKANGTIFWQGEDSSDSGCIEIKDNEVKAIFD